MFEGALDPTQCRQGPVLQRDMRQQAGVVIDQRPLANPREAGCEMAKVRAGAAAQVDGTRPASFSTKCGQLLLERGRPRPMVDPLTKRQPVGIKNIVSHAAPQRRQDQSGPSQTVLPAATNRAELRHACVRRQPWPAVCRANRAPRPRPR